ncbi:hypothetical protein M514_07114, partial [Trichuris suis]
MWLADLFHQFPRLNFAFEAVGATCDFTSKDYIESLIIWGTLPIIVCVLLFLVIVGLWSVKCCSKSTSNKPKSDAKAIASGLIICLVVSCIFIGVAIYCNEHSNKAIAMSVDGVDDLGHELARFGEKVPREHFEYTPFADALPSQVQAFNHSFNSDLVASVRTLVNDLSKQEESEVRKYEAKLTELVNSTTSSLNRIISFGSDLTALEQGRELMKHAESERWILFLILLATILLVNIGGLLSSCRLSAKGITFGAGMFTYLLAWAMVAGVFVLCLSVSDFCVDPYPFMEKFMHTEYSRDMLQHFKKCVENALTKPEVALMSPFMVNMRAIHELIVDAFMDIGIKTSAYEPEGRQKLTNVIEAFSNTMEKAVTLQNMASCENVRVEYKTIRSGLCFDALSAFAVMLIALLAFGTVHFVTMIIASSGWRAFQRRSHVYVDPEGNDPLLSRNEAAALHTDFYGSHVFNPRSRLAASVESCNAENPASGFRNTPPPAYEYGITSLRTR